MSADIRIPIGSMFLLMGVVLAFYGLGTSGAEMYAKSLGMNMNIYWGGAMLLFGAIMLAFGLKAQFCGKDK
ncbi:MAG: hypothetical protein ACOX2U_01555 [Limisphaerales bacterium]|jgi:hypothetical protein|nr:hypothetical protein [Verrucomicrobiota bacterium]